MTSPSHVSIHGGHSGQFCNHAENTLEEMVLAYIDHGYPWVGITEHMPPVSDRFLYPDEVEAGLTIDLLTKRFGDYIDDCRRLKQKYAHRIRLYVGFETEWYSGSLAAAKLLMHRFSPDYVVGSIHHVNDIPFDYSERWYQRAVADCGTVDRLYSRYFDQQYDMIRLLKPRVVGHLDIIRIYDGGYRDRLLKPEIWAKIVRNLELVQSLGLILDYNLRPLSRGEPEPYLSVPILRKACEMGVAIVPGDDAHRTADVDQGMAKAIQWLRAAGGSTDWQLPVDVA